MLPPGTELARVDSYKDLLAALVARRYDIGLPQAEVEEIAGLHKGYVGKIECGMKRLGSMSLECLLGALGVELVLVATTPHHVAQGRIAPGLAASAILGTAPRKRGRVASSRTCYRSICRRGGGDRVRPRSIGAHRPTLDAPALGALGARRFGSERAMRKAQATRPTSEAKPSDPETPSGTLGGSSGGTPLLAHALSERPSNMFATEHVARGTEL